MLVLDTSAILSGKPFAGELVVPPAVDDELAPGGRSGRAMDFLRSAGLQVIAPSGAVIEKAREAAARTGDLPAMSAADLEVVALAIELVADVATDDYRIQNVLRSLGLRFQPVSQKGIRSEWRYVYLCGGCGRRWDHAWENCPVCGGAVRLKRER